MSAAHRDELPRLLTGEADRDEVMTAAAHLRELRRLPAGTGVGRRRARLADLGPAIRARDRLRPAGDLSPRAARRRPDRAGADAATRHRPLPDLSAVFAQVREEAAEPRPARSAASTPRHAHRCCGRRVVIARRRRARPRYRRRRSATATSAAARSTPHRSRSPPSTPGTPRRTASDRRPATRCSIDAAVAAQADRQALRGVADQRRAHPDAADRLDRHRTARPRMTVPDRPDVASYTDIEVSVQPVRRQLRLQRDERAARRLRLTPPVSIRGRRVPATAASSARPGQRVLGRQREEPAGAGGVLGPARAAWPCASRGCARRSPW